jgi:hypothetical protein
MGFTPALHESRDSGFVCFERLVPVARFNRTCERKRALRSRRGHPRQLSIRRDCLSRFAARDLLIEEPPEQAASIGPASRSDRHFSGTLPDRDVCRVGVNGLDHFLYGRIHSALPQQLVGAFQVFVFVAHAGAFAFIVSRGHHAGNEVPRRWQKERWLCGRAKYSGCHARIQVCN